MTIFSSSSSLLLNEGLREEMESECSDDYEDDPTSKAGSQVIPEEDS